ncbi:MAG: exopolysaccharide biosynthesis protein [Hyphomonadaceae bacterium]
MPKFIQDRAVSKQQLKKAEKTTKPVLKRIDQMITDRLTWAASGAAHYVAAVIVTLLALLLIPLELVPFAVMLPGAAIAMIGVALLARDGALMLVAFALAAAAFYALFAYSPLLSWLGFS